MILSFKMYERHIFLDYFVYQTFIFKYNVVYVIYALVLIYVR